MSEKNVPKWQRELRSFIGIKKGILLEGNVYDEYPLFDYSDGAEFIDIDDMDHTILSLIDMNETAVVFFDPVNGFYCYKGSVEEQKQFLNPLFKDYTVDISFKNHDCIACMMPSGRNNAGKQAANKEKYVWVSEIIRRTMADKSIFTNVGNVVFVINFASRLDACNLSEAEANMMFLNLAAATTSGQTIQSFCNSLIMVVDKCNDVPAWVYLNNPNIRSISVNVPDRAVRRLYLQQLYSSWSSFNILSDENYLPGKKFIAETEGMRLQELKQIIQLAYKMSLKAEEIDRAFQIYKYGIADNPWENLDDNILTDIEITLTHRVKGQSEALRKVKSVVTRAVKGLSGLQHSGTSHKPKGILFFAGPTGVGKTETAKALAESIFGDENACIRFDMSEYRLEQSDQKLFGAPPGYVGYEGGGQLTNAVKEHPFSVLLFDEIEKASPTILDKFLQVLEDGRMTDNQGNTVYFGETIIIFTSNIGLTKEDFGVESRLTGIHKMVPTVEIKNPEEEDTLEFRTKVTQTLTEGVKAYFTNIGRPELLNRLGDDNIVVFQFINKHDAELICDYKLEKICQEVESSKGITISTEEIKNYLRQKAVLERANGGRGVGNMLEREFLNPLSEYLCTLKKASSLQCYIDGDKVAFAAV